MKIGQSVKFGHVRDVDLVAEVGLAPALKAFNPVPLRRDVKPGVDVCVVDDVAVHERH